MEAFFWFFGEFLECVCGARQWGKQKEHQLISKATLIGTREKIVTKSDEAFALLLYENNINKWKTQGNIEDNEDTQYDDCEEEDEQKDEDDESVQSGPRRKKTRNKALRGKYTCHNNGTTKYGGWSDKGMTRFNELYELVKKDRKCPRAAAMEKQFLERAIWNSSDSKRRRSTKFNVAGTGVEELVDVQGGIVQPAWESDDESTTSSEHRTLERV